MIAIQSNPVSCARAGDLITLSDGADLAISGVDGGMYILHGVLLTSWRLNLNREVYELLPNDMRREFEAGPITASADISLSANRVSFSTEPIEHKQLRQYSVLDMMRIVNKRLAERGE